MATDRATDRLRTGLDRPMSRLRTDTADGAGQAYVQAVGKPGHAYEQVTSLRVGLGGAVDRLQTGLDREWTGCGQA